jgi:hypothetical protein
MNQYQDVTSSSLAAFLLAAICLSACLVSGCGEKTTTAPLPQEVRMWSQG